MPKPLNGEFYTQADDELMMTTPDEWPRWPILPVKKSISEVGFLYGDQPALGPIVVYLGSFYGVTDLDVHPKEVFTTPKEACDAGWKVD